jgi:uncharacterized membrane protein
VTAERALRAVTALLALVGLGVAGYLTYAKYADAAIACTTGGCEKVQNSDYATLAGIPVPVLGLVGYAAILATAFVAGEVGALAAVAVTVGGFAFAIYLVYVQYAIIDAFCMWCLISDVVMGLLLVVSVIRLLLVARGQRAAIEPSA